MQLEASGFSTTPLRSAAKRIHNEFHKDGFRKNVDSCASHAPGEIQIFVSCTHQKTLWTTPTFREANVFGIDFTIEWSRSSFGINTSIPLPSIPLPSFFSWRLRFASSFRSITGAALGSNLGGGAGSMSSSSSSESMLSSLSADSKCSAFRRSMCFAVCASLFLDLADRACFTLSGLL